MRVGIFSESYPPLINGVSTSVQTLTASLEHAGHTVFIFTSRYPHYQDERAGVFRFPSSIRWLSQTMWCPSLFRRASPVLFLH